MPSGCLRTPAATSPEPASSTRWNTATAGFKSRKTPSGPEPIATFSRLRLTRGCAAGKRSRHMEKKIAGLLGAVAALSTMTAGQAAPAPAAADPLQANSYADLVQPIPNAAAVLKVVDEREPV